MPSFKISKQDKSLARTSLDKNIIKGYVLSILFLNACDTYLAMIKHFLKTVKGITYLCVVKLYRILQCLRFFSFLQFESNVCSTELKLGKTIAVCCQSLARVANLVSYYECPNPFSVRGTTIFVIFSHVFRKLNLKNNLQNFNFSTL